MGISLVYCVNCGQIMTSEAALLLNDKYNCRRYECKPNRNKVYLTKFFFDNYINNNYRYISMIVQSKNQYDYNIDTLFDTIDHCIFNDFNKDDLKKIDIMMRK
jgi:hypothetical protein